MHIFGPVSCFQMCALCCDPPIMLYWSRMGGLRKSFHIKKGMLDQKLYTKTVYSNKTKTPESLPVKQKTHLSWVQPIPRKKRNVTMLHSNNCWCVLFTEDDVKQKQTCFFPDVSVPEECRRVKVQSQCAFHKIAYRMFAEKPIWAASDWKNSYFQYT